MFGFFKQKKVDGQRLRLKIDGMHCSSCSLNIDGELEDTAGVVEAKTSYAKAITEVTFDPQQVSPAELKKVISDLGYKSSLAE